MPAKKYWDSIKATNGLKKHVFKYIWIWAFYDNSLICTYIRNISQVLCYFGGCPHWMTQKTFPGRGSYQCQKKLRWTFAFKLELFMNSFGDFLCRCRLSFHCKISKTMFFFLVNKYSGGGGVSDGWVTGSWCSNWPGDSSRSTVQHEWSFPLVLVTDDTIKSVLERLWQIVREEGDPFRPNEFLLISFLDFLGRPSVPFPSKVIALFFA